ncbi:DUF7521 family protein [Halogeometricum borinquense]|uniref:Uncharacterized protein n=1 Tax=Halogeometricum borinquense (strain ATCC 700274 / DSM 11551 / JCM 10706 / KCTC 4070 / PR3) TaxID=469382 RepID=E4NPU1_HALBP|nr:hypothetical protein [Halogeometricum borinquense]ADQ66574.1 hypothetical protein Hbor_09800 [Halogeometricum borinquense DSM 11551]
MIGQVSVTGGSAPVVLSVFTLFAASLVLSVLVTYRFARGYLRTGTRPLLQLAVGMLLLAVVPILLRVSLTTAGIDSNMRILATSVSELFGLLTILYTIYDQ